MNYRSVVVIGHPQVHTLLSFLPFDMLALQAACSDIDQY